MKSTHYHAIEAVDHGGEIHLPRWNLEFGDVCQPFLIGGISMEVSIDQVLRRLADFPKV